MARSDALIVALSNAGDASSVVLRWLRNIAHEALGDPDNLGANDVMPELLDPETEDEDEELDPAELIEDDSLGIFEWSAPPGCSVLDRDGWAQADPALGYTVTERNIASAARTDPEWVFRTEVLCQWSEGGLAGPFPAGSWEACAVPVDEQNHPQPGQNIVLDDRVIACLDVSWDRATSYVAVAGKRRDGLSQVEVVARRPGTDWVTDWFCDSRHPDRATWPLVIHVGSPAWALAEELMDAGIEVTEWKGRELGTACAQLYDAVKERNLRHLNQPVLNVPAATTTIKPLGNDTWAWDRRRSSQDASPLVAVTGAYWLLRRRTEEPPPAAPLPTTTATDAPQHELAVAGF
jgi:hypothetical protein